MSRMPRGRELGLAYAVVVAAATLTLLAAPAERRTELVLAVSTDPDRLLQHPVRSLLLSPLVVPELRGLVLLPVVGLTVGAVQSRFGTRVTVLAALLGHAAVSVSIAGLLERDDAAPDTAAAADVGVSYVLAVTAGVALVQLSPRRAVAGALAGTALTTGLLVAGRTSTDAGHLLAWLLGLALGALLRRRWSRAQEVACST